MSNELFSAEVLIALGILAVPTACITYFIYAIAKVKPAARPIPHFPHGVEGWLLVFVATMALSIILTAFSAMNTLSKGTFTGQPSRQPSLRSACIVIACG